MNERRFELLIETLKAVPAERLEMHDWVRDYGAGGAGGEGDTECGTVACAVGWYAIRHPEEGLALERMEMRDWDGGGTPFRRGRLHDPASAPFPADPYAHPYAVAAAHFDISLAQANTLFSPRGRNGDDTKVAVLRRLMSALDDHRAAAAAVAARADRLAAEEAEGVEEVARADQELVPARRVRADDRLGATALRRAGRHGAGPHPRERAAVAARDARGPRIHLPVGG